MDSTEKYEGAFNSYYSFVNHMGKIKCYYRACNNEMQHKKARIVTGYAHSFDGIKFTKSKLGSFSCASSNFSPCQQLEGETMYAVGGRHLKEERINRLNKKYPTTKKYYRGIYLFSSQDGREWEFKKKLFDGWVEGSIDGINGFSRYDSAISFLNARGKYFIYVRCNLGVGSRRVQCYTMDKNFENGKMQITQISPDPEEKDNIYYLSAHYIEEINTFVGFAPCYRTENYTQKDAGIYLYKSDDGIEWKRLDRVWDTGFLNSGTGTPNCKKRIAKPFFKNCSHICNGLLDVRDSSEYDVYIQRNYYQYDISKPTDIIRYTVKKAEFHSYITSN